MYNTKKDQILQQRVNVSYLLDSTFILKDICNLICLHQLKEMRESFYLFVKNNKTIRRNITIF